MNVGLIALVPLFWATSPEETVTSPFSVPYNSIGDSQKSVDLSNDFSSVMNYVSKKHSIVVICEDRPAEPVIPKLLFDVLQSKISSPNTNLEESIACVTDAYDYKPLRTKQNILLLQKRYSKKNDIPQVPFREVAASVRNIQTLLGGYGTGDSLGFVDRLNAFNGVSLSKLEKEYMPVSSLSPLEQGFLWDLATSHIPGQFVKSVRQLNDRLDACDKGDVFVRSETYETFRYPAYEGPFRRFRGKKAANHVAISGVFFTSIGGGTSLDLPAELSQRKNTDQAVVSFVESDPVAKANKQTDQTKITDCHTIAEEVHRLNQQWDESIPLVADPVIADKRVCLFGRENSVPQQIILGIAQLYDLRYAKWRQSKDAPQQWRIMLHAIKRPMPGEDVSGLIWQQIPLPIRTYFLQDADGNRITQWNNVQNLRARDAYMEGMKRLRPLADEALVKSQNEPVSLNDLTSDAKDLIAITSIATAMQPLFMLAKPLPMYLKDFSHATVKFQVKDDPGNLGGLIMSYDIRHKVGKRVDGMSGWHQEKKP